MDGLGITLPDGRRLAYAEYGNPAGTPVLYFHGSPGSRFEAELAHEAGRAARVRVIAPERPGYGASDFQPDRRFDDWPRDVAVLADVLGLDAFAIIGLSGGAPHALACAVAMPDRITGLAIVSGAGPIDAYIARSRTPVGRWLRRAFVPVTRVLTAAGMHLLRFSLRRRPPEKMSTWPDPRVLSRPAVRAQFHADLSEALRPGARGAVHEYGLHTRPWPFALADVRHTVHLWHGEADVVVKPDIAQYVAQRLPDCLPVFLSGEGHLLIVDHIAEVLRVVTGSETHTRPLTYAI